MLYDIGFLLFSIIYLPTLIFKGKLHGQFGERFGAYSAKTGEALGRGRDVIWVQAVSVGEVALCRSFIPELRKRFPQSDIVLSTITRTGNELARKLFSNDATIVYFPLDLSFIVKKAASLIRPKVYVMVETEIWPNLLKELRGRGTRTIIVNGRISDRSIGKYRLAKRFLRSTLEGIDAFCMQSETDAARITELGAPTEKVKVTGNMKFDADTAQVHPAGNMKTVLGMHPGEELFVAGSTHRGEEDAALSAFKRISVEFPLLRLLIAPRHIERVAEVERAVNKAGLQPVRVSRLPAHDAHHVKHVFILDTIGHLNEAFAVAEIVFIGGSLIKHGGQNPLEPAALGKPVIYGPHMFNFRQITEVLSSNDAAVQVENADGLYEAAAALLRDRNRARDIGWNAKRALTANRGATLKNVEAIQRII